MGMGEKQKNGFYFDYNPDSELYGPGNVDYGHNLAEFMEKDKIEFSESTKPKEESKLEKSLNLVNGLFMRKDVSLAEKRRVLSQVRKWGCYSLNKSPWEMNAKQIDFFFTDALNILREKLGGEKDKYSNGADTSDQFS